MHIALYKSRHTVESRKNQLVKDLKDVVVDADELLREVAGSTAEEFAAARAKIQDRLRVARSRLDHARVAVTRQVGEAADAAQEYARENPWKAFGIPAVAALIVFLLVSRRS